MKSRAKIKEHKQKQYYYETVNKKNTSLAYRIESDSEMVFY